MRWNLTNFASLNHSKRSRKITASCARWLFFTIVFFTIHNSPVCPVVVESSESLFFRDDLLQFVINCDVCILKVRKLMSYALHFVLQNATYPEPGLAWTVFTEHCYNHRSGKRVWNYVDRPLPVPHWFNACTTLCVLASHTAFKLLHRRLL